MLLRGVAARFFLVVFFAAGFLLVAGFFLVLALRVVAGFFLLTFFLLDAFRVAVLAADFFLVTFFLASLRFVPDLPALVVFFLAAFFFATFFFVTFFLVAFFLATRFLAALFAFLAAGRFRALRLVTFFFFETFFLEAAFFPGMRFNLQLASNAAGDYTYIEWVRKPAVCCFCEVGLQGSETGAAADHEGERCSATTVV